MSFQHFPALKTKTGVLPNTLSGKKKNFFNAETDKERFEENLDKEIY